MRYTSYWFDSAPTFQGGLAGTVEGHYDVVVIGAGFTGLGAALELAKGGASVLVLEADHVGAGGSGRNGGHLNNGIAHSFPAAIKHLGTARAVALYRAYDASIDTLERLIAEEGIECNFRRSGKLKLAAKPAHMAGLAHNCEVIAREVDPDVTMLSKDDIKAELGSDRFHGGMLYKKSAMMHMGRYATGLAEAVVRHGGTVAERAAVVGHTVNGGTHTLKTPRGTATADTVVLATGAYTPGIFGYFRRRIVPVGSFIVATRPLTEAEMAATIPGNRTYVTTWNVGHYFRQSPDNRLIFGGRARFAASADHESESKSGTILRASLAHVFPHLANVEIDYCWGGLVDMTKDRFPRAGYANGVWFAMGYSGHGAQMSTLMGMTIAGRIQGKGPKSNPFEMAWPAIPGYFGTPWFLPFVGLYYRTLDVLK